MDRSDIQLSDLQGEQKELARITGLDVYLKLVEYYGGTTIYVAKADRLINLKRDNEILRKYNGFNAQALAKEYNLSDRTIREIINEARKRPLDGQLSLNDTETRK